MYTRILVPLDGSATAERGLREAIGLAMEHKSRLRLMHVLDDFPMLVELSSARNFEASLERLRVHGENVLAKGQQMAHDAGVPCDLVLREVTSATVADAIVDEARTAGCDLIVMGTHGRSGVSRLTMGSEAELVVRTSPTPVLLVRKEEAKA